MFRPTGADLIVRRDSAASCTELTLKGTSGERGATSVEVVTYTTLMMTGLLLFAQALVWALAALACQAAANHALQATRISGGSARDGIRGAGAVLDQLGRRLVSSRTVEATRTTVTSTVTIRGKAPQVVPALRLPITVRVAGPTEPEGTAP